MNELFTSDQNTTLLYLQEKGERIKQRVNFVSSLTENSTINQKKWIFLCSSLSNLNENELLTTLLINTFPKIKRFRTKGFTYSFEIGNYLCTLPTSGKCILNITSTSSQLTVSEIERKIFKLERKEKELLKKEKVFIMIDEKENWKVIADSLEEFEEINFTPFKYFCWINLKRKAFTAIKRKEVKQKLDFNTTRKNELIALKEVIKKERKEFYNNLLFSDFGEITFYNEEPILF